MRKLVVLSFGLMAFAASAAPGVEYKRAEAGMSQPSPCYAVLHPQLEFTDETIKYIHAESLKGKSVMVALRTELADDGTAATVSFARKSDNEEINEVAEAVSKIAAVKCAIPDVTVMRDLYDFSLSYEKQGGDIAARPKFTRYLQPVLPAGTKVSQFCEVESYDDSGVAEKVNCDYDSMCTLVGDAPAPRFPKRLNDQGRMGVTGVAMTIDPSGQVIEAKAYSPSGQTLFDNAAVAAAKTAKFTCEGKNPVRKYGLQYVFTY